jgi:hypothetical protein
MRSLATLGVPLLDLGAVDARIPLSRLTDVSWHDTGGFAPLIPTGQAEGYVPLSRLTDVFRRDFAPQIRFAESRSRAPAPPWDDGMWGGPIAIAPGEQESVRGAAVWDDLAPNDNATIRPWPSFDPRSDDLVAPPTVVVGTASASDSGRVAGPVAQESGSGDHNLPRITVTPWQFDPGMTPESGAGTFSNQSGLPSYPGIGADVDPAPAEDPLNRAADRAAGAVGGLARDFRRYLSNSADGLFRIPSDLATYANDFVADPGEFVRRAAPGLAGLGMAGLASRIVAAETQIAALARRAHEIHAALVHPAERNHRTTAVLSTNGKTIAAGGVVDLNNRQKRGLRASRELAAARRESHAEITALSEAYRAGLVPRLLATTRAICPVCRMQIEALGGRLTSPTTAIFPRR